MQTLTPTLLAAQKQASARPYVRAVFSEYLGTIAHLRMSRYYTGSEGEYYSAVAVAGDGSLNRARIDPATKVLYTQRVASPGMGSNYALWTSHGTVSASSGVAMCAGVSVVLLFYVDTDTKTLRWKQSSDYGATYGSAAGISTAASAVTYVAAAISGAGQVGLFWSIGAVVWAGRYNGSSWSTPAAWSNSVASLTGIACCYVFDFEVAVCGTQVTTMDAKVWTTVYGDGLEQAANTWSPLVELTTATGASNVSFRSPALAHGSDWRLYFVEMFTGTEAYARLQTTTMSGVSYRGNFWREASPFDYPTTGTSQATADYGVAAAAGAGTSIWLSAAAGVWYGATSSAELDVSADVVEAEVTLSETDGRVHLLLRNDPTNTSTAGRYAAYGSGALSALRRGNQLALSPGYYTSSGAESGFGTLCWVESIEETTGPEPRLIVTACDAWWLLERWRARRQYVWPAGSASIREILLRICAAAGLDYGAASASTAIDLLLPGFTMNPGENARSAVLRLLDTTQDRPFSHHSSLDTRYATAGEATDYTYGTSHAIVSGRYREAAPATNRVRVVGTGVFNEGFDFAEVESMNQQVTQVTDLNVTTAQQASDVAAAVLRTAALEARRDEVVVQGVNCGQELYDVVEVTDAQAGLTAAKRRVLGLRWRYDDKRYEMTLTLGAV